MNPELQVLKLSDLRPNAYNFRMEFEGPEFDELVASINKHGVIQPILARPKEGDTPFEIVFGERRWRAAKAASGKKGGKKTIPAMVRDITDDEAFDLMVIENLQREDLNELEEAKGFQAYLERNGKEAVQDLADRCKINPAYIRRRVSVLGLPEEVLAAWGEGQIAYGYLEQLTRLDTEEDILAYFEEVADGYITSIKELKRNIDNQAVGLDSARFDLEAEGCLACAANSDVQIRMFDVDAQEARCGKPKCFAEKQHGWLVSNWGVSEFADKFGTNGFRFYDDVDRTNCRSFYGEGMEGAGCFDCPEFVTIFSGPKLNLYFKQACVGDEACYNKAFKRTRGAGSSAEGLSEGQGGAGDPPAESDEPRVAWHGAHFREIFFKEQIPRRFDEVSPRGVKAVHLALFALIQSNGHVRDWFSKNHVQDVDKRACWVGDDKIFGVIAPMPIQEASEVLKAAVLQVVMGRDFDGAGCRRLVAEHIGIDLAKQWRFNEEYLQKKTIAEMLRFGDELGIFDDPLARAYLQDENEKKRFDKCKKGELVDVFLKSGADLAGKVPKEILAR
jgi:ParB/RepB/Spo0J family partition protein